MIILNGNVVKVETSLFRNETLEQAINRTASDILKIDRNTDEILFKGLSQYGKIYSFTYELLKNKK